LHLAQEGYHVFAGMRNPNRSDELQTAIDAEGLPIEIIQLDVTNEGSVKEAFSQIDSAGPLEVLVNNAGIAGATPLELTPEDEHRAIFETNYFGALRCIQSVLPSMRERGRGAIVNVTSIAGLYAVPNQIAYSASKWALECLGEALAGEVRRFGVRVVNIEPGVILTKIFENSEETTRYEKTSPYQPLMRRNGKFYLAGFQRGTSAAAVAETILESITSETYRLRWPVGDDAHSFVAGRSQVSDEDCVALNDDLSDEEYNRRFFDYYGIQL
jgi:NAD(P)-dependent dehydrogenase (short-subunit alcohol dehydrogenase family)